MAKNKNLIEQKIKNFYNLIKNIYPIKKMILFGSYNRNQQTINSDIDVGVVVDMPDHLKRIEITAGLFHYAGKIDLNIEPKCIFWDEFQNYDRASILGEIVRTGKLINI